MLMQFFNHFGWRVMSIVKDVRWAGANTGNSVLDLVRERGLESKKIGLIGALPYQHYNKLREQFPNANFVDLGGKLRMIRTVRSRRRSTGFAWHRSSPTNPSRRWHKQLKRHARRRNSSHHRAGLSQAGRLCGHSLHEQHADAPSRFSGAVAVSIQPEATKRAIV